jgi:resuscitation-promoting factor RpfB
VRRSIKYGLYAAVLASVLGSTIAWATVDKTVNLDVDGQSSQVHTVASTVKGALADAGYKVGDHDIVAPDLNASVHGGTKIVLQRGRLLRLTIDGTERDVWVTSSTVQEALQDLGYESADLNTVSRSKRLPLTPTDLKLSTIKSVTLTQGTQVSQLTTTDAYVGDLLHELGVTLGPDDTVTPAASVKITPGDNIVVQRITHATVAAQAPVPFATTSTNDATINKGTTKVVTPGKNGVAAVVYAVVYVDGVETGRTVVSSTTITPPTNQVQKVGTKAAPAVSSAPIVVDPGSAQAIAQQMLLARGWGNDQFQCLLQIWGHESGWRVNAANASGAYGIPQALPGSKMAAYGADWRTNPATQISWGLAYIAGRYSTPCGAWSSWQAKGWY